MPAQKRSFYKALDSYTVTSAAPGRLIDLSNVDRATIIAESTVADGLIQVYFNNNPGETPVWGPYEGVTVAPAGVNVPTSLEFGDAVVPQEIRIQTTSTGTVTVHGVLCNRSL